MPKTLRIMAAALALGVAATWLLSCSSKSNPTKPMNNVPANAELNGSLSGTGSQYAHMFNTAGTFNYRCTIHASCSSLTGTIVVIPQGGQIQNRILAISQSGGTSGPYGSSCASLSLQRDTVFVGDTVTWTNNSTLSHTVTSQ